ncbi:MAG: DNA-directed RNA polymerase [Promethearchaeati archaeon SRVP18_Atabeyarchaeia-1]
MYKLVTVKDIIRIPPDRFGEDIEKVAMDMLNKDYGGVSDLDIGFVISIVGVDNVGIGKLIPGDGGAYHEVTFKVLTFKPQPQEVIEGEVVEIVEFGAFIRLGPTDGLCHVSQVTDDFISYNMKKSQLLAKESRRILSEGDKVRARIIAISLGEGSRRGKIGLTMRQPFLGKLDWFRKEEKEQKEGAEQKEPKELEEQKEEKDEGKRKEKEPAEAAQ